MTEDYIHMRCVKVLSSLDHLLGKRFSNRLEDKIYVPVCVELPLGTIRVCSEAVSVNCDTSVSLPPESDCDDFNSSDVLTLPERPQQEEDLVLNVLQKLQQHKLDKLVKRRAAVQCAPDKLVDITGSTFTRPVSILRPFDVSGMDRVRRPADNIPPVLQRTVYTNSSRPEDTPYNRSGTSAVWSTLPLPNTSRQPTITSSSSKEEEHECMIIEPSDPSHSKSSRRRKETEHAANNFSVSGYKNQHVSGPSTSPKRSHSGHSARRQRNPQEKIKNKKEQGRKSSELFRLNRRKENQQLFEDLRILTEKNTKLKSKIVTVTTDIKLFKSLLLQILFNK